MNMIYSIEPGSDEIWKVIKEVPYYSISNYGRIKVTNTKSAYASMHLDRNGYFVTTLKGKTFKVHRLVAIYFIENSNPDEYDCVNHKDENKQNNYYKNLEWCNRKYNNNYGTKNKRAADTKSFGKVIEYDANGNVTNIYCSLEYVAKNLKHGTGIKDAINKNTFNRYFGGKYYFYYNEKFDSDRIKQRLYIIKDKSHNIVFKGSRRDIAKYFNITVTKFDNIKTVAYRSNKPIIINNYRIEYV